MVYLTACLKLGMMTNIHVELGFIVYVSKCKIRTGGLNLTYKHLSRLNVAYYLLGSRGWPLEL